MHGALFIVLWTIWLGFWIAATKDFIKSHKKKEEKHWSMIPDAENSY
jgi:hypothetical protein